MSELPLALLQVGSLYKLDAAGRLLAIREPGDHPPPRLHLLRTSQGSLAFVRHDLPESLASELVALARSEPWPGDDTPDAPPVHIESYRTLLADSPIPREYHGPCFALIGRFPEDRRAVRIDESNDILLEDHFEDMPANLDVRSPAFAVIADTPDGPSAVSLCFSSRNPGPAVQAGVHTVESHRQHGYATAVTAAWAREVTVSGRLPLYGTTWDNIASQHIAATLGGALFASESWLA